MRKYKLLLLLFCGVCLFTALAATYRDAPQTDVPDFKQTDPRWCDVMYSNHSNPSQTIGNSGCVLCSVAGVVHHLCDDTVTPIDMAQLSMQIGKCADRGGTYSGFYTAVCDWYPLTVTVTQSLDEAEQCIDSGGLVIVSGGGHSRLMYAHTGEDYWLHDSGWNGLLGEIMGHMTREKLMQKEYTYYCYQRRVI